MRERNIFDQEPVTYLITSGDLTPENFNEKSGAVINLLAEGAKNGISLVQIREKKLPARMVYKLVADAVSVVGTADRMRLLVNDRADIALAAGADGVHLTSKSIPAALIRRRFPEEFIIGVSVHSFRETARAKKEGADFALFGPIFATPSKAGYGLPQGIKKLSEVSAAVEDFPVIAVGGIDQTNYKTVLEHGARGFAAIRFLNDAANLRSVGADLASAGRKRKNEQKNKKNTR